MTHETISVVKVRDVLLATLPPDPDDMTVSSLQANILHAMKRFEAKGVILDLSQVGTLDSYFARTVIETGQMIGLMGGMTIIAGMQVSVAITATQLGLTLGSLLTSLDVDRGPGHAGTGRKRRRGGMMSMTASERSGKVRMVEEGDIVDARKIVRNACKLLGFNDTDVTRVVTAASELARNVIRYAGKGEMHWSIVGQEPQAGLELVFEDEGPGIADMEKAMTPGFSTVRGLGLGLPGAKRLMDEFDIRSVVGQGTTVTVRKWRNWNMSAPAAGPRAMGLADIRSA